MSDGKIVIDVDLDSRKAEKSVDDLNSKIEGAFQDKAGRWRAADGRFLTMAEKADMLGESFEDMGKKGENSLKGIEPSAQTASIGIGKIVTALGLMKLASSAVSLLKSSLDGAITRYDTMNNFPKVMKQLGFSTEESAAAVDKLADGVTGLPTPLNEIVSSAQGLAVMTGDLDGATDTALALNNAFLASGASSADASRGLDQYVQMLAKGEVDMQSWRTLQETMGLALNETAKAFGFTGKAAQNDLYAALQDGSITFDQFNDKLIELDGGVDGFAKRARTASGGIATAFANMRTAAVRGLEGIIRSIDESLAAVNFPSIQQMIENFGKTFENALKKVAAAIPPVINFIANMINILKPFAPIIMGVVAAILTFATGISVINGVSNAIDSMKLSFEILGKIMAQNPMLIVVAALIGLGVALYTAYQKSETFRNKVNEIWASISDFLKPTIENISAFITNTWESLSSWWKTNQEGIKDSLMNAWNAISAFLTPIVQTISDFIMSTFGIVSNWWNKNQESILSTATTVWNAIKSIFGDVFTVIVAVVQDGLARITEFWDTWGGVITAVVKGVWAWISNAFEITLKNILTVVSSVITQIKNIFVLAMNVIKGIVKIVLSAMEGDWSGVLDGIKTIVSAFWEYIKDTFTNLMNTAKELVNNGIEGIKNYFNDVKNIDLKAAGKSIIDKFLEAWSVIPEFFSNLWNSVTSYAAGIWSSVVEVWNSTIESIKAAWGSIGEFFSVLWVSISNAAIVGWGLFIDGIMLIVAPFIEAFKNIWTAISPYLSGIWENIKTIATSAWELIKIAILTPVLLLIDAITGDFSGMKDHLIQIWNSIKEQVSLIVQSMKNIINIIIAGIVTFAVSTWNTLKNSTINIFNAVKESAINAWNALKSGVVNAANAVKDGAVSAWNALKSSVINAANAIKNGAVNAWNALKSGVISAANSLKSGAINAWSSLKSSVINLANNAKQGAINAWNSLKSATSEIFNNVVSSIKSILNIDLYQVGKNIIQGLINGIGSMVSAVGQKIQEVAGGIKDKITGALGIHSPSRWMRDKVGKMLPQGIAVGIEADTDTAVKAMDKMNKKIMMPQITAEAALGIGGRMSTSPNSVMNSNVTNNYTTAKEDTEIVRLLKVIANKPFLAEIDGKRVTKAISQEMDKSQGNRIKLSDWGIEING